MRIDGDGDDLLWDDDDEDTDDIDHEDEDDREDEDAEDAWPEVSRTISYAPAGSAYVTEVPAREPVSARFMVLSWVVIIPALLGILAGFWISSSSGRHHSAAYPAPWSCAHELKAYGAAALYPLCGTWKDKP